MSDGDSTRPDGERPQTLADKLAAIAAELGRFAKTEQVSGKGGYAFASVDSMSDVIRPAMAEHGIVMYPRDTRVLECQQYARQRVNDAGQAYETIQWRTVVVVTWHVADASQVLTLQTVGEALDTSDKSANKAQTAARKYAMIQLFNISTGDDPDPDHDRPGDEGEQRTNRRRDSGGNAGPQRPNDAVQKLMRDRLRELCSLGNDDTPANIATWLSERYPAMDRAAWEKWIEGARTEDGVEWPAPLDVEQTKALTRTFADRAKKLKA